MESDIKAVERIGGKPFAAPPSSQILPAIGENFYVQRLLEKRLERREDDICTMKKHLYSSRSVWLVEYYVFVASQHVLQAA